MTTQDKVIKTKLGLLELGKQLGNVSQACKVMGYSRDSYYRFKELYDAYGDEGLRDLNRSKAILKIGWLLRSKRKCASMRLIYRHMVRFVV